MKSNSANGYCKKKSFVDFRDGVHVIKCCALGCNCDLTFWDSCKAPYNSTLFGFSLLSV
jgi:hypothetical protein